MPIPSSQARTITVNRQYPRTDKRCAYCGSTFAGIYCHIYCGVACRNRADYQRQKQRKHAAAHYERLRKDIIASGVPPLNDEELRAEIAERKGR